MGFKSKSLPSSEVFKADGQSCQCFYPKNQSSIQPTKSGSVALKEAAQSNASNPLATTALGSRSWLV
jgi:hypothetical protein